MPKDPNRPKGRMSAYAFFVQERRAYYRNKGLSVNFTDFSRECAGLWKELSDVQKSKYVKSAELDKVRYDNAMSTYTPPPDSGRKRKKKKKDPRQPKRNMSAFFFFCAEKRPKIRSQNQGATVGEIAKQLGEAWKLMSSEQKSPYDMSANADKTRYVHDMELYKKGQFVPVGAEENDEVTDDDD